MNISLELVVFYILLIDSLAANAVAWFGGEKWYVKHFRIISRYFPAVRGWTTYYLILVLWYGFVLYRLGELAL